MKYIIKKEFDGMILKDFLRRELGLSGRLVKSLKKYENGILLNGIPVNVLKILKVNDELFLDFCDKEEDTNEYLEKSDIPVDVIYEDENYTVVNKGANMPTHQSLKHYTDTLANALAYRYQEKPYVFRAINRLDKDTSGIVVTANNRFFADFLSRKLKDGKFCKQYIAIVVGKTDDTGVINAPIRREQESIITRIVADDGDEAITEYKTICSCDEISVLLVTPITNKPARVSRLIFTVTFLFIRIYL
jgi:23S rRNA pseudouridine1911/1915/1917 synthase